MMKEVNIEKAILYYYKNIEIGNAEIMMIFNVSNGTAVKKKQEVQKEMAKQGKRSFYPHSVNTKFAYELWGIDINHYEYVHKHLKSLDIAMV